MVPFGLTTVASATDAALQKEIFDSGLSRDLAKWTKWMIFDEEMNDIMKIGKSLEDSAISTNFWACCWVHKVPVY